MRYFRGLALAALIGMPALASAATAAELQAQADALLQQIAAIQAQLGGQNGTQGGFGTAQATPVGGTTACPLVGRILSTGSTGEDVTRLQQFLARDASVYPEGMVTGYYGSLTEAAVKRWQAKNNIVSSGTPATTGYGQVGPRTAAAMSLQCAGGSGGASGVYGGYIQVSPVSGNAPLTVKVTATVNTAGSCSGGTYTLTWGDGSPVANIIVPSGQCGQLVQDYAHQYIYGGTYTVKLSAGAHSTSALVTVSGAAAPITGGGTSGSSLPAETFKASVSSGNTPLSVTFSGVVTGDDANWCASGCSNTIDFGDGSAGTVPLPTSRTAAQNYSINHTYTKGGVFTAVHYQGAKGASKTVGSAIQITASGQAAGTYTQMQIQPNAGGNPLAVAVQFDMTGCPAFSLTWGDGGSGSSGQSASSCVNPQQISHTYAQAGTYTITLVRGSQTDTASIAIQ